MQKFKIKTEFGTIILPKMRLRRQHLTDELVEKLRRLHPATFATYFEEVKDKKGKPLKIEKNVQETPN